MHYFLGTALMACAFAVGQSHAADADILQIDRAWARATSPGARTAAAYLRITNPVHMPADVLLGVNSEIAANAELHSHLDDQGVMRMRSVASLPIPPGQTVEARPGGLHVMLLGIKKPLVAGQEFMLSLRFERAGSITVPVKVETIDHVPPSEHHHH